MGSAPGYLGAARCGRPALETPAALASAPRSVVAASKNATTSLAASMIVLSSLSTDVRFFFVNLFPETAREDPLVG